jgi:hypothetical protein
VGQLRPQIRPLHQNLEMFRRLGHGALHQLDIRPLPRVLEQASRGVELLATGAQLSEEHREIQETRRDEGNVPLAAKTGIIVSRFTSVPRGEAHCGQPARS